MQYREIVFLQEDEAEDVLAFLSEDDDKAFHHLMEWDYGEGEIRLSEPWGRDDQRIKFPGDNDNQYYVLSYNRRLSYIGLTEVTKDYWDGTGQ